MGLSLTFFTKFRCTVPHMVSLRPDVSICHIENSENKCQQLLYLPFVSILIFLIRCLSVEISRLTTVSIYSGRLPVVLKNGLNLNFSSHVSQSEQEMECNHMTSDAVLY